MPKEKLNIQELTIPEVEEKIQEMKKEIFNLRFRNAMRQLDNPLRIRFLRRDIARYTTALAEHRQGIRFLATGEEMPPTGEGAAAKAKPKPKPKPAAKVETKPAKAVEAKAAAEDVSATSAKSSEKPKRRVPWSRGKKKE